MASSESPERTRVWTELASRLRGPLAIAIAINLLLLLLLIWSRPGQATVVRLEADGNAYRAYLDGRLYATGRFDELTSGGISVVIDDPRGGPTLPTPHGIDNIRVTELSTGKVLFEDDFSRVPGTDGSAWKTTAGVAALDHGVVGSRAGRLSLMLAPEGWRDYAVEARFRNIAGAALTIRQTLDDSGATYSFRPYRHLDNVLGFITRGKEVTHVSGAELQAYKGQTLRSIASMLLTAYPAGPVVLLLAGTAVLTVLGFALQRFGGLFRWPARRLPGAWDIVLVAPVVAVALGLPLYLMAHYAGKMPHVPDELSYIFQAKILASGHFHASPPPVVTSFQISDNPLEVIKDGHWASLYTFGHPMMLAFGQLLGAMWAVPPLIGATCVLLVFVLGRKAYGKPVGLLAAALFAASPFYLMTASNFMSHNTAAMFLLITLTCLAFRDRRPLLLSVLAGLSFGMLFNTRPLSGVAVIPPLALWLALPPLRSHFARRDLEGLLGFAAGAVAMLGLYFAYRWLTLGNPFELENVQAGADQFGFGGAHSLAAGLSNEQTQVVSLLLVLFNVPKAGIALALLPFMLGTRNRWDWLLAGTAVCLAAAYTLYFYNGLMHGPRFWYDIAPLLFILSARGIQMLGSVVSDAGSRLLRQRGPGASSLAPAAFAAIALPVLVLTLNGSYAWLLGRGGSWDIDFVPNRASALKGFNGINDGLVQVVDDANLKNALVIVDPCSQWWCYGNVSWLNSPWLDGNVVFAKKVDSEIPGLLAAFEGRQVYEATYGPPSLKPFARDGPLADASAASNLTPPKQAVSDGASARDERRKLDLGLIAQALAAYKSAHGDYPPSRDIQTLCRYPFDAGCALKGLLNPIPSDPLDMEQYWYRSTGDAYVLFARLESEPTTGDCPDPKPTEFKAVPALYCVKSASQAP